MSTEERIETARQLMSGFVERTGVRSGEEQERYLWTDAFAVCNLLGLARATGDDSLRELALLLVERVHHTLGRHRPDDPWSGWLGSASEEHPTRGGLRIGKPFAEREPDEPFDERLEWDRDGQYFHYLTKWMHALDQASRATGRPRLNEWARELAQTAHRAFTYRAPGDGDPRMYWKMSIDLSRPLVRSMGQHDPLDGYVTVAQLGRTAAELDGDGPALVSEQADFARMMEDAHFATDDPLGLGGLLSDAYRVEQMMRRGLEDDGLLELLLAGALSGLASYSRQHDPDTSPERRLAFRELGLAIGLHAVERMAAAIRSGDFSGDAACAQRVEVLRRYLPLRDEIERFWMHPSSRRASTWTDFRDIDEVMLATSLAPDGFLELGAVGGR